MGAGRGSFLEFLKYLGRDGPHPPGRPISREGLRSMVLLQPLEIVDLAQLGLQVCSSVNRVPWYSLAWDVDVTSYKNVSIHKQTP